jgi:Ni/Fe-hydrogenase 1 B-type cytochrome subunit
MNPPNAAQKHSRLVRLKVYDGMQRILHWWIGLCIIGLISTGLVASNMEVGSARSHLWTYHILVGKALIVAAVGRLVWGLIGPHHAKIVSLIHPTEWVRSLRTRKVPSADGAFGHHPQASLSYLGFYGLLVIMSGSGMLLAAVHHGEGPLGEQLLDQFKNIDYIQFVHEYGWIAVAGFIVTHVGALIFHEWHDRIPIAQSMISGYQYRTVKEKKDESIH